MRSAGHRKLASGWLAAALVLFVAGWPLPARGQTDSGSAFSGHSMALASATAPGKSQDVLRELVDPHSGDHWLLLRDPSHAGGPGRLVLAPKRCGVPAGSSTRSSAVTGAVPVIRAGDTLVVEEHTAIADARLEAVALNAAPVGQNLNARLKVGGKVVRVMAEGRGLAVLAEDGWEQR